MKRMSKRLPEGPQHQEVFELLPWLVNNTLDGRERLRVLNHLSECKECQLERDRLQQLEALVKAETPEDQIATKDYQPSFKKLMAKIDQAEHQADVDYANAASIDEGQLQQQRQANSRSNLWRYIPAAVAAVVLVVVGTNLFQSPTPIVPQEAQTLSVPQASLTATSSGNELLLKERLSIYFEEAAGSETIRSVFVASGAYIVDGPDAQGRYIVEVLIPENSSSNELLETVLQLEGVKQAALLE